MSVDFKKRKYSINHYCFNKVYFDKIKSKNTCKINIFGIPWNSSCPSLSKRKGLMMSSLTDTVFPFPIFSLKSYEVSSSFSPPWVEMNTRIYSKFPIFFKSFRSSLTELKSFYLWVWCWLFCVLEPLSLKLEFCHYFIGIELKSLPILSVYDCKCNTRLTQPLWLVGRKVGIP